ncbi:hypothetical protein BJX99DRAFT_17375 [Aspergillus californicus]
MSAKNRLQRSKSARFVRSSHNSSLASQTFDPEIARLYATAAASKAMSRSRERHCTLSNGSYGCLGGPRTMAVPQRRYKHMVEFSSSGYSDNLSANSMEAHEHDQHWPAALPSISEFGSLEDRIASLPSSYRRLRKSRSMFSTKQRSSHNSYGLSSPDSYSPSIRNCGPTSDQPRLYRTLRRSMSFLRRDNGSQNTLRHAKSQDVAVELARSQYEHTLLNSPDSPQWAPLLMSKTRQEQKPFRKTFRTSSTADEIPTASVSIERARAVEPHRKSRTFSSSIKKGIKRVLGISRNPSEQGKPQASPSSHHWGQSPSTVASNENYFPLNHDSLSIHHLQVPAAVSRPPTVRKMQSAASMATSRSRVTSWADSTAANTLATPRSGGQHRQSIISEQGSQGQADLQPPAAAPDREVPSNAIDSHRLFSALMKRIGGVTAQTSGEAIHLGHVKEHRAIPTQGSLHFHHSRQTIRQIPSDGSINSPRSFATANINPVTPYDEQPQDHGTVNVREVTRSIKPIHDHSKTMVNDRFRAESDSPSVYSRTTNGTSPCPRAVTNSPDSEADPGVATIFASERTTYVSPIKSGDASGASNPPQSGADWQNWMDSQIARIEKSTPNPYHYRENAQIQDDHETSFTSSVPARRIRVESRGMSRASDERDSLNRKASTNSNFSRPFSRSSSLCTVVKVQDPSFSTLSMSVPLPAEDDIFRDSGGQEPFLKSARAGQKELGVSPMLSRPSNQLRRVESPTPKRYRAEVSPKMSSGKYSQSLTSRSPASLDTRTLQRRSARSRRENLRNTNENARMEQGIYDQPYGLQSPMSSKRMVEIFLNSRRRQMGADISDEGAADGSFL